MTDSFNTQQLNGKKEQKTLVGQISKYIMAICIIFLVLWAMLSAAGINNQDSNSTFGTGINLTIFALPVFVLLVVSTLVNYFYKSSKQTAGKNAMKAVSPSTKIVRKASLSIMAVAAVLLTILAVIFIWFIIWVATGHHVNIGPIGP